MNLSLRIIKIILLFHLGGCTDKYKENPQIVLEHGWKFITGDSLKYANCNYDDSKWKSIEISKDWQSQGFDHVGFSWYRIRVFIPSSLKNSIGQDYLRFFLGKIADSDQFFLNGILIGENNRIVTNRQKLDSAFTYLGKPISRRYIVPVTDPKILWNRENLIAIRVFNRDTKGGLVYHTPFIKMVSLIDSIRFDKEFYKPLARGLDTNLAVVNTSSTLVSGDIYINCKNMQTGKIVFQINKLITLKPSDILKIPLTLPITTDQTKVLILFREHRIKALIKDSITLPYVLTRNL